MTKKDDVIMELKPIADILNIKLDYIITDNREYLVCDDVKISTCGTSVSGIRQEFFGYVFLNEWHKRVVGNFDKQVKAEIRRYWYD